MNTIPLTNLPTTDPAELLKQLQNGTPISLVYQKKVVGTIQPAEKKIITFDVAKFKRFVHELNLPKTTPAQREKRYRKHLTTKYGKGLS